MSELTQSDTTEVRDWYQANEIFPPEIGFDPDGMCLKICRTARNIAAGAPTALASAALTPERYRVYDIADLRGGMLLYFDDPTDDNPFGHVTTMMGRVPDYDPDELGDIVNRTNSVIPNQIVPVLGDYFEQHWGDKFMFGAMWLNGEPFYDLVDEKPQLRPKQPRIERTLDSLTETIRLLKPAIERQTAAGHTKYARALTRDLHKVIETRAALRAHYKAQREGGK